jgi:hypothetical protein
MTPGVASLNLFGLATMWLLVAGMAAVGIGLALGRPRHRLLRLLGFQPKRRQRRYGVLLAATAVMALAAMTLLPDRVSALALLVCALAPLTIASVLDRALPGDRRRLEAWRRWQRGRHRAEATPLQAGR